MNITVPQPEFSNWVIQKRTELGLLHEKLFDKIFDKINEENESAISPRTLKNIEAGKQKGFQEHTINTLARGLDLTLPEIKKKIEELKSLKEGKRREELRKKNSEKKFNLTPFIVVTVIVIFVAISFQFFKNRASEAIKQNYIDFAMLTPDRKGIVYHFKNLNPEFPVYVGEIILEPVVINLNNRQYAITASTDYSEKAKHRGVVFCFDDSGKEVWKFDPYDLEFLTFEPENQPKDLGDFFRTAFIGSATFFGEKNKEYIWVVSNIHFYALARFSILDPESGEAIYSLWSWGRFQDIFVQDLNEDGLTDVVLAAANNNFAKMVAKQLNITYDFDFGTTMLLQPEKNRTFCVPGFYYKPECPCGSLKWMALAHPSWDFPYIGEEVRDDQQVIMIGSDKLGLYYNLNFEGELNSLVRTNVWTKKFSPDQAPPLLRFMSLKGEIIPQFLNLSNEEPIPLEKIYNAKQVDIINKLSDLTITLDKEQIPTYTFTK